MGQSATWPVEMDLLTMRKHEMELHFLTMVRSVMMVMKTMMMDVMHYV